MEDRVTLNQAEQRRLWCSTTSKLERWPTPRRLSCWASRPGKYGGCEPPNGSAWQQRSLTATGIGAPSTPSTRTWPHELWSWRRALTRGSTSSTSPRCSPNGTESSSRDPARTASWRRPVWPRCTSARPARHRRRRERMPREGMLLQIDGSRHDWLEGRGPFLTAAHPQTVHRPRPCRHPVTLGGRRSA